MTLGSVMIDVEASIVIGSSSLAIDCLGIYDSSPKRSVE